MMAIEKKSLAGRKATKVSNRKSKRFDTGKPVATKVVAAKRFFDV
jgi:hypothetical protein